MFIDADRGHHIATAALHGSVLFTVALWLRITMMRRNIRSGIQIALLLALLLLDVAAALRTGWR